MSNIGEHREQQIRRDTDDQKNFTVSLYDIDETILNHLNRLQLQVVDNGKVITVPAFFGSPEQWKSAQKDGYIRDKQGKILLPAIILKRTSSESDTTLQFFNRYINTSALKLYSSKNRYTAFSTLSNRNVPVGEVYNVVMPSHMLLTYHFVIWTEYVSQMNKLVEQIQIDTKDYWGTKTGFRFRTKASSYAHTVEVKADDDRMVKTEFDLEVHGYIITDTMTRLDNHNLTTQKVFTPKKIVIGAEVVSTDYDFNKLDKNKEKWRNPTYSNIPLNPPVPSVPMDLSDTFKLISNTITNNLFHLPPPTSSNDTGKEGWVSYDASYYYVYTSGHWKRVPIALFNLDVNF